MIVAVAALSQRRRSALLLYAIAAWWFFAELASPSVEVPAAFALGLALAPAGPAIVAHLALSYPTGKVQGWPYTTLIGAGYVVMIGVMGLAGTAVFDPSSTGCFDCPVNPLLVSADPVPIEQLSLAGLGVGAAWLILTVVALAHRAVFTGPGARATDGAMSIVACSFLGASATHYLTSLPTGALTRGGTAPIVWQVQGAAIVALAAVLAADLLRARRSRRQLTRLVVELGDKKEGGLRAALARRLHDPTLIIGYPIQGGRRHVDADARPIQLTPIANQVVTPLTRGGTTLATLIHRPGILRQPQQSQT